jgi:hypothetical protein
MLKPIGDFIFIFSFKSSELGGVFFKTKIVCMCSNQSFQDIGMEHFALK